MQQSRSATTGSRVPLAPRAGTSLTDILVVMTVASVIIGLSGMTIHRLLAAEHEATRAARFTASAARLSRAFRADVRAATGVELRAADEGQPAVFAATLADRHEVRYELDAHLATRIETREGRQIHRDDFRFPPRSQLRCVRSEDGRRIILEIDIPARGPESLDRPGRKLVIEAALSRDHRFAAKPRQPEGPVP
ncbi:MAG TPA: hypothetical protein VGM05_31695 [Planctomycetaceae bacterium]|jgi:hypothetical protein